MDMGTGADTMLAKVREVTGDGRAAEATIVFLHTKGTPVLFAALSRFLNACTALST